MWRGKDVRERLRLNYYYGGIKMKKVFKRGLESLADSNTKPTVLRKFFFIKQVTQENFLLYYLVILGPNDAVGSFDSGELWGYEFVESDYWGEYRDRVDIAAYEDAIEEGFNEISEDEFMRLVEEKYPDWRNQPGES
jgi:hypothetical protein